MDRDDDTFSFLFEVSFDGDPPSWAWNREELYEGAVLRETLIAFGGPLMAALPARLIFTEIVAELKDAAARKVIAAQGSLKEPVFIGLKDLM